MDVPRTYHSSNCGDFPECGGPKKLLHTSTTDVGHQGRVLLQSTEKDKSSLPYIVQLCTAHQIHGMSTPTQPVQSKPKGV